MTLADSKRADAAGGSRSRLIIAGSGAAAGLIASLALSALILLVERAAALPVGTFYLVLVSAITQVADYDTLAIAQGLLLHLLAGTVLGAAISAPFAVSRTMYGSLRRLAPAYGLGAGALIWLALFVPVTFGTVEPLLRSLDGQSVISQRAPIGDLFKVAVADLLGMMDRVVYVALAFNMFYGLLTLIITRSFAGSATGR